MNRQIRLLLAFLALFYSIFLIQDTYAKYLSNTSGNTKISIARWNILINEQDIKLNNDFTSKITPVLLGNEHIAKDVIAPTAEGYFDIIIDARNTDVSFTYTLNIAPDETSVISDLIITGYSINNSATVSLPENSYGLTETVNYNDETKVFNYRFFIKWNDDENATMDNAADTEATKKDTAKFNVNIGFVQLAQN